MSHLSTLIGFFTPFPVAVGVVGPAVVWLLWFRRDAFLVRQAREALNFHCSVLLYALLLRVLPTPPTVMAVAVVAWLALVVVVAARAYDGRPVRYPAALPILRAPAPRFRRG